MNARNSRIYYTFNSYTKSPTIQYTESSEDPSEEIHALNNREFNKLLAELKKKYSTLNAETLWDRLVNIFLNYTDHKLRFDKVKEVNYRQTTYKIWEYILDETNKKNQIQDDLLKDILISILKVYEPSHSNQTNEKTHPVLFFIDPNNQPIKEEEKIDCRVLDKETNQGAAELWGLRKTYEDCVMFGSLPEDVKSLNDSGWKNLFEESFCKLDDEIKSISMVKNQGSTLCVNAIIGNQIYNANLGDSESFLVRIKKDGHVTVSHLYGKLGGEGISTSDQIHYGELHKPDVQAEKDRIGSGCIKNGRLLPPATERLTIGLSVSGTIGDHAYGKRVTHIPNFHKTTVELEEGEIAFVVTACDGLREGLEKENEISLFNSKLVTERRIGEIVNEYKEKSPDVIAEKLASAAEKSGSKDNISAIVMRVDPKAPPCFHALADGHGGDRVSRHIGQHFEQILKHNVDLSLKSIMKKTNPALSPQDEIKVSLNDDDSTSEEHLIQKKSEPFREIILPHLPPKVDINHIEYISEENTCFLIAKNDANKIDANKIIELLKDKESGFYSKKDENIFPTAPRPAYSIVKQGKNYYAVYEGEKKEKHLGKGANAVVKLAQNLQTGEWVVLKLFSKKSSGAIYTYLISKETDNIKAVNQYLGNFNKRKDDSKEKYGLLAEFKKGISLKDLINNPEYRLSPVQWIEIFIGLCEGIDALHQQEIIHRDIKPDNLIFDPGTGKVHVVDYGSAESLKKNLNETDDPTTISNKPAVHAGNPSILDGKKYIEVTLTGATSFYLPPNKDKNKGEYDLYPFNYSTDVYAMLISMAEMLGFLKVKNLQRQFIDESDLVFDNKGWQDTRYILYKYLKETINSYPKKTQALKDIQKNFEYLKKKLERPIPEKIDHAVYIEIPQTILTNYEPKILSIKKGYPICLIDPHKNTRQDSVMEQLKFKDMLQEKGFTVKDTIYTGEAFEKLSSLNSTYLQLKNNPAHTFFGWKHSLDWQTEAKVQRDAALIELRNKLKLLSDDSQRLIMIEYALTLPLFNQHRSNYLRDTANTSAVKDIIKMKASIIDHLHSPKTYDTSRDYFKIYTDPSAKKNIDNGILDKIISKLRKL